jgi:2-C-methyl-D-erythritol 4-phosphate cytidylyltransferase
VHVTAIIVAGGPGTRLGRGIPKAFVPLAGAPLVVHTLRALLRVHDIGAVVVVVPSGKEAEGQSAIATHGPWRLQPIVAGGGAHRQDSVRAGLAAAGETDVLLIHDAARPFIDPPTVHEAVAAAAAHGAAVVGIRASDTVKRVDASDNVEETPPRERLWMAQTPQVFRADLIRAAHAKAVADGVLATDDSALVERLGLPVRMVLGSPENRKITTPDDLRWAEWRLTSAAAPR